MTADNTPPPAASPALSSATAGDADGRAFFSAELAPFVTLGTADTPLSGAGLEPIQEGASRLSSPPPSPLRTPSSFPCAVPSAPPLSAPPALPAFATLPAFARALSHTARETLLHLLHSVGEKAALEGQHLLLAVSGGADSVSLAALCALWRQRWSFRCTVAHMNHNLRAESAAEARFVTALATAWGMDFVAASLDVHGYAAQAHVGHEEAARVLRYAALELLRQHCGARWLCTAHHAGDAREDTLLRLLRGTGWPALGGMHACDTTRRLCRPLMHCEPDALRRLLQALGVTWMEDPSNADTRYTRNRVRHELLPLLRTYNAGIDQHLQDLRHMAQDDTAHWEAVLDDLLRQHGLPVRGVLPVLPATLLRACDKATRMRLYVRAVRAFGQGQPRYATLAALDAAWCAGRGGLTFELPGNVVLTVRKGNVAICQK